MAKFLTGSNLKKEGIKGREGKGKGKEKGKEGRKKTGGFTWPYSLRDTVHPCGERHGTKSMRQLLILCP